MTTERTKLTHLEFIHAAAQRFVTQFSTYYDNFLGTDYKTTIDGLVKSYYTPLYTTIKNVLFNILKFADNVVNYVLLFVAYLWLYINLVLLSPVTLQLKLMKTVFYWAKSYNEAVQKLQKSKSFLASYIPLFPLLQISNVFRKMVKRILKFFTDYPVELRTELQKLETQVDECFPMEEHKVESRVGEQNVVSRLDKVESADQDIDDESKNSDEDNDKDIESKDSDEENDEDIESKDFDEVEKDEDNSESQENPKGMVDGLRLVPSKDPNQFPLHYFPK